MTSQSTKDHAAALQAPRQSERLWAKRGNDYHLVVNMNADWIVYACGKWRGRKAQPIDLVPELPAKARACADCRSHAKRRFG